ncbi:hypothetical protein LC087_18575 [Bacillus carboniphilus]|uniref:Uncharacterized protein n=1 Tax=Bacillus carboniphilus TaxID=86663 RepID=A0ABY9JTD9_9BACI|nr:hypothetical protein [Bacillus carboniphilus]WLR42656.1 hypothetical protein LC087_18575 [Bacillus carboniphilus]
MSNYWMTPEQIEQRQARKKKLFYVLVPVFAAVGSAVFTLWFG